MSTWMSLVVMKGRDLIVVTRAEAAAWLSGWDRLTDSLELCRRFGDRLTRKHSHTAKAASSGSLFFESLPGPGGWTEDGLPSPRL